MNRMVGEERTRRSSERNLSNTRSGYALAQTSHWHVVMLWASFALLATCLLGFALSLRNAGALAGLIISPAAAAEFSEVFVGMPSVQLSQGHGNSGSDELAAAMLVPKVDTGPLAALAAADGSNIGPLNAPGMQLAIAAMGGGISTMINYPFGFWCSDSFRVMAGSDASNLNRLCTGSVPAGVGAAVRGSIDGGDEPPLPPLGPCESLEVLSLQTARLSFSDTHNQSSGTQTNSLPSGSYNNSGNGAFGFTNVNVQQNNGVDVNQQISIKGGAALGSRLF